MNIAERLRQLLLDGLEFVSEKMISIDGDHEAGGRNRDGNLEDFVELEREVAGAMFTCQPSEKFITKK